MNIVDSRSTFINGSRKLEGRNTRTNTLTHRTAASGKLQNDRIKASSFSHLQRKTPFYLKSVEQLGKLSYQLYIRGRKNFKIFD